MKKLNVILKLVTVISFCLSATEFSANVPNGAVITLKCIDSQGRTYATGYGTCVNPNGCTDSDIDKATEVFCKDPHGYYSNVVPVGGSDDYIVEDNGKLRYSDIMGSMHVGNTSSGHYLLFWQSLFERRASNFQVLCSFDELNWTVLTNVDALGYSQTLQVYNSGDLTITVPASAHLYFKLIMMDSEDTEIGAIQCEYEETHETGRKSIKSGSSSIQKMFNQINLFPNPASNQCIVNFGNADENLVQHIEIRDLAGKVILSREYIGRQDVLIDISSFTDGLYLVTINNGWQIEQKKLAKTGGN